ncbi:hypothetical protein [uncultured Salinisphaera sp.]|uniref:hypothetical protein n=1 Tax=uncultured Salinisphaera sp. TaxID=359372 RepID=UPI0032B101F6|tara:strand:+ start:2547 stop:2945 length:399 start_codon:yes stop_codon:yes gene_type:complete
MNETVRQSDRVALRVVHDIWDVFRAASPKHLHLRNRLLKAVTITVVIDLIGSTIMFVAEHGVQGTQITSYWDAVYWTTSQLTTLSAPYANPLSTTGQITALALDLYAITVVSTLAGMFSAFFYQHEKERASG